MLSKLKRQFSKHKFVFKFHIDVFKNFVSELNGI